MATSDMKVKISNIAVAFTTVDFNTNKGESRILEYNTLIGK